MHDDAELAESKGHYSAAIELYKRIQAEDGVNRALMKINRERIYKNEMEPIIGRLKETGEEVPYHCPECSHVMLLTGETRIERIGNCPNCNVRLLTDLMIKTLNRSLGVYN